MCKIHRLLPLRSAFAWPACLVAAAVLLPTVLGLAATEPDAPVTLAATYESGMSAGPLHQIERLLREAGGTPERRAELESALLRLLAPGTTFEAKRFACAHLAVYGSEASLASLASLLDGDATVGMACLALSGLPSAKADDLLCAALPKARGKARLQLISTLGHRASPLSVKPLSAVACAPDAVEACAAVRALGAIPEAAAREALAALRRDANPALMTAVAAASLNSAEQLAATGHRAEASKLCGELLADSLPTHIRRGAFSLLLQCDADGGLQRVRAVLETAPLDSALAAVAIAHGAALRDKRASSALGDVLPHLPPATQVLLVEALASRGDPKARAIVRAEVGAADPGVRRAAIAAVGNLEGASAVALLVNALAQAATPEERKEIQLALASLQGGAKTDRALCKALGKTSGATAPALVSVLSRRGGPAAAAALLDRSTDSDPTLARAAAQALLRIADSGDPAALSVLQKAVTDDGASPPVRETALRTLAAWRGTGAWETLLGFYLKPASEAQRALALRGLVRAAGQGNTHPDAALMGRYRQLLAGARNDADRALILHVLAGAEHPEALTLVLPLLELSGLRAEAGQAVERIATAVRITHPEASRSALEQLKKTP